MNENVVCRWEPKHPEIGWQPNPPATCRRPAEDAGLCLFHRPKCSDDDLATLDEAELRQHKEVNARFSSDLTALLEAAKSSDPDDFLDLRGVQFPTVHFGGWTLGCRGLFGETSWGDGSTFTSVELTAGASFKWATFGRKCGFYSTKLGERTSFEGATLGTRCAFFQSELGDGCSFVGATLKAGTSFLQTKLGFGCSFLFATFEAGCKFQDVTLGERSVFDEAKLGVRPVSEEGTQEDRSVVEALMLGTGFRFLRVTFGAHCSFNDAVLTECSFVQTTFGEANSFVKATLGEGCVFEAAEFGPDLDFDLARINGRVVFDATEARGSCLGPAWFTRIVFGKDGALVLRGMDLRQTSFLGTNIEKVTFENPRFARYVGRDPTEIRGFFSRLRRFFSQIGRFFSQYRLCLWDELRARDGDFKRRLGDQPPKPVPRDRKQEYFESLAANYRQLVINLEAKRAFEDAEDLYVGEMEARRKQLGEARGWRWGAGAWLNGYAAYKVLSEYGVNLKQALLVLMIMVLVFFPIGFMHVGFVASGETLAPTQASGTQSTVDWDSWWLPDVTPVVDFACQGYGTTPCAWLSDWGAAVQLTLSIVSFQKDRFYVPINGWGRAWLMLAFFALTGQLALFLFALRRRFRR